ncbi:MAG TPA: FlgD immunoglobulin-like domain containing protein [Anaerolineales bacterium]|nr:FlgD immunoglobulin-like domain containing protein [Anaerolineales bacterium]
MQQQIPRTPLRRRRTSREEFRPGLVTTAVSIGAVLVLLSLVFVADWLRTPDITLLSSTALLSPNSDQDRDFVTVSYKISEEGTITAQVVSPRGGLVQTLLQGEAQNPGQYSLTWNGLNELGEVVEDGQYRLEIVARGTLRASQQNLILQVDTTPPTMQLANVPNGLRVRENALTIEGVTDPDANVFVTGNPQPVQVDGQGNFAFLYRLNEGPNALEIRAVDPAGNSTTLRRDISLIVTPPEVVIASPVDDAFLSQSLITVSGQASPDVTLTVNEIPVSIGQDGTFNHQLTLEEGDNLIRVVATDDVGNVTLEELVVHLKSGAPSLSLNIEDGETFNQDVLQLTGHTDPGAIVQINGQVVPVGEGGDFQLALQLFEGQNIIDVVARDQAGNTTNLTRQVRYALSTAPTGLERLWENLTVLPNLTIPFLLLAGLVIALVIFRQRGVTMTLAVDQPSFKPGLPNEGKVLLIWLELSRDTNVTLEVLDPNGFPRTTILQNRRRTARKHTFSWDGYDDYGRPVPPGDYTLQAEAGTNPVKVSTAIPIRIEEDILAHRHGTSAPVMGLPMGLPSGEVIDVQVRDAGRDNHRNNSAQTNRRR